MKPYEFKMMPVDECWIYNAGDLGVKGFEVAIQRRIEKYLPEGSSWYQYVELKIYTDIFNIYENREDSIIWKLTEYYNKKVVTATNQAIERFKSYYNYLTKENDFVFYDNMFFQKCKFNTDKERFMITIHKMTGRYSIVLTNDSNEIIDINNVITKNINPGMVNYIKELSNRIELNEYIKKIYRCEVCGCTDTHGCANGCWWVNPEKTLCSNCEVTE